MHVPDGFLDASTSLATAAVAAGTIGLALRRADREVARSGPALAGLTAAFVFSVQMVNFPVGAGTSGHLLGGALAAALVGPWTAVLVVTVVLLVQALLFADGGLTALGTNITLMAVVGVAVAVLVTRAMLAVLPRRPRSVVPAAAVGALVSVPAAAAAFTALYAVGGVVPVPTATLAGAMVGWHVLIGIGEALITSAVLGAVIATRPDLVHAARGRGPGVVLVDAEGHALPAAPEPPASAGRRPLATGLAAALVIGGVVSLAASAHPDGLEHVAASLGFDVAARDPLTAGSPLADYAVSGVASTLLSGGLSGAVGVLVTVTVGVGAALLVRTRATRAASRGSASRSAATQD